MPARGWPLLLLAVGACTGGDDETDADTDVDTDVDIASRGAIGCGTEAGYWRLAGPEGSYTVRVDTVAEDTTFDPFVQAFDVAPFPPTPADVAVSTLTSLGFADDSFDCTFAPATFRCPQLTVTSTGADVLVEVTAAFPSDCAGEIAEYGVSAPGATLTILGNVPLGDTGP